MHKMKKITILVIALFLIINTAQASKGLGLVWGKESDITIENTKHCIEYGLYNPGDQEVTAYLGAEGNLKQIAEKIESEPKLVPPGTEFDDPIPVEICFYVSKVYDENCLLGNYLCEQKCSATEKIYEGAISIFEVVEQNQVGGSTAALSVSAPLKAVIKCSEHPRDWSLLYIIIIIIVGLLIGLNLYKKYKTPPQIKKAQKIQKLETKLNKMKSNK